MHKTPTKDQQTDLETLYSKYQLLPVLREQFGEFLTDNNMAGDDFEMHKDMLSQIYLHRQADVVTMVGILSPKHGTPQEVADKLVMAAEFDLIDYNEMTGKFIVKYEVSDDVVQMLERYQYPLPMITEPNKVTQNNETGYETIKNSVVLNGSPYFKDKDMCLDHLNRANSVALELNFETITSAEGKFKQPKRKPEESFDDHRKRVRQATVFFGSSLEIMEGLSEITDKIYITHRYDRRGRCYASGYHISTQGDDYKKAVLQLANKEVIT